MNSKKIYILPLAILALAILLFFVFSGKEIIEDDLPLLIEENQPSLPLQEKKPSTTLPAPQEKPQIPKANTLPSPLELPPSEFPPPPAPTADEYKTFISEIKKGQEELFQKAEKLCGKSEADKMRSISNCTLEGGIFDPNVSFEKKMELAKSCEAEAGVSAETEACAKKLEQSMMEDLQKMLSAPPAN